MFVRSNHPPNLPSNGPIYTRIGLHQRDFLCLTKMAKGALCVRRNRREKVSLLEKFCFSNLAGRASSNY